MKNIKTTINEQDYLNDLDYCFGLAADHGETVMVTTDSRHDVGICPAERLNPYHDSCMETVLIYAVRYGLQQRETYVMKFLTEHIQQHISGLSDLAVTSMISDIETVRQTQNPTPFKSLSSLALEQILVAEWNKRREDIGIETEEKNV